ncbi:Fructosamine kinase-domain-containing protein [Xylariaceae sp. FL0255]|nr:Fructosamine kinase-domain-containing protein [Xylariaceae sp. FL0255]
MAPIESIEGGFIVDQAIIDVLPKGTTVVSAEPWGLSAWSRTAKLNTLLADGTPRRYFVKCATGKTAKSDVGAEHFSASAIVSYVPEYGPCPVGKGVYEDAYHGLTHFYVQEFHDMDTQTPPDPADLASLMAKLHRKSESPNGMFGYPIFSHLLKDLLRLDNEVNGPWPEFETACNQLLERVIPKLLGALQSNGRSIKPSLVHGDLWEGNVATDMETGKVIIFDFDECMYAHHEIEMGTWRCRWATHFNSPMYMLAYQQEMEPSEPVEEFDDRNRLYSIKAAICDSAGHRGSVSRQLAYNDMLYLCEKYAPLESLERYDPLKDISVTGIQETYDVLAGVVV